MPRELIGLGRPPRTAMESGDAIPEFQMWVGWNRDMDVQVGIGVPQDTAEGMRSVGLVEALFDDEMYLNRVGEWLATFARNATADDKGTPVEAESGDVGYWEYDAETLRMNAKALVMALDQITSPHGASIWWHPTRHAINNLIRVLRKARDQAFGKDE